MRVSGVERVTDRNRVLNAVALQNAVLCAECDVVSDSPHDTCLVCGSRSLFNISRIFGGILPNERASLIAKESAEITPRDLVLAFPKLPRGRRGTTAGPRQIVAINDHDTDEVNCGVLLGPKGR